MCECAVYSMYISFFLEKNSENGESAKETSRWRAKREIIIMAKDAVVLKRGKGEIRFGLKKLGEEERTGV